ncbi:unnamed protein product [Rodentolepis nana]|uniref:Disintegrin domain-containing protein n=1 Tax=Rodentolepis nana TaxID=102285 RepID=A0A0R3T9C3_RODNA|nr:unnamed protein product [Rodentolepis nana]
MGANTSKDEIFLNEIGCDTIGTVPCNASTSLFCLEGECALYVADFEKKCVEGCKCNPGLTLISSGNCGDCNWNISANSTRDCDLMLLAKAEPGMGATAQSPLRRWKQSDD